MTTTPTVPTFEALYETYYARIYQHVLRLVHHVQDAEDVTQEAFLKAYRALPRFDPARGEIKGWLYRIATHAAYDHLRKTRNPHAACCSFDALPYELADDDQPDPQARYEGMSEQAMTALRHLHPHYRELLVLHGLGYSLAELASHFGKTERTLTGWLTEARHAMNEQRDECA